MGYISPKAYVDLSPLDAVNQVVRESPVQMRNYQRLRVRQAQRRIRLRLKAPEDLPQHPFIWSYDKAAQLRAARWWFANKVPKGSKSGRYERTGELEAATEVSFIEDSTGGYFIIENDAPGSEFVIGERQVPSHYLTGWPLIDDVVEEEVAIMSDQLVDDWYFVSTGGRVS